MDRFTNEERVRIMAGIQCPECFGPWVQREAIYPKPTKFVCNDCGCQWDRLYFHPMRPELPKAKAS